MSSRSIELPERLAAFAEEQAAKAGDLSTYLADLIQQDQKRQAREGLERELMKGIESGPGIEADDEYWERKRRELVQKHGNAEGR